MNRPSLAFAALAVVLLAGCASSPTPQFDASFGEAVRQARAQQTLNPDASRNEDPVAGIDARAGKAAIDRYQESWRAPPRTFDVLNIGGSGLVSGSGQ